MPTTDPLVSTEWLAEHLNDPNVKVVDASFKMPGILPLPKDDYLAAHLPGAVFFDVDAVSDHSNPLPHMFPSAEQFGRDVGGLGIGNGDTVVLYDSGGWVAAPRAWWMFLSFGHDNVRILKWMVQRIRGTARATETPVGAVPTLDALDLDGLAVSPAQLREALRCEASEWLPALDNLATFYGEFGARLPAPIAASLAETRRRFERAA